MNEVAIKNKYGDYDCGYIIKKNKKESLVFLYESEEEMFVKNSEIIIIDNVFLDSKTIKDLLFGNASFDEYQIYLYYNIYLQCDKVSLDINELDSALKYLMTLENKQRWFMVFLACIKYNKKDICDINKIDGVMITAKLLEHISNEEYDEVISYYNEYLSKKSLPLKEKFTKKEDKLFLLKLAFDLELEYDYEVNDAIYSYLTDKEFDDNLDVIYMRSYSYYGGNSFCPCDYKKAEENLLILYENGDTFAANSLGYIYYYGRVNNGIAQYDLAYKYFSIAAFANETEAIIKISDMFKNGYFIEKNYKVAFQTLNNIYNEQLRLLEYGYNNKFADIALRIGTMFENGYYLDKDVKNAIKFYMMAKVAIILREINYPHFGDISVKKSIDKSLERLDYSNFKWSLLESKSYALSEFVRNNTFYTIVKRNKKNEMVIHLNADEENKKIILDLKNKKAYFSNKITFTISSKHELLLDEQQSLNIFVLENMINIQGNYIPLKDVKIKFYDEIHISELNLSIIE